MTVASVNWNKTVIVFWSINKRIKVRKKLGF